MASPFTFFTGDTLDAVQTTVNGFIAEHLTSFPVSISAEYHGGKLAYVVSVQTTNSDFTSVYDQPPLHVIEAGSPEELSDLASVLTEEAGDWSVYPPFGVNKHGATYFTLGLQRWLGLNNGQGYTTKVVTSRSLDDLNAQIAAFTELSGYVFVFGALGQPFLAGGVSYQIAYLSFYNTVAPLLTNSLAFTGANPISPSANSPIGATVTFNVGVEVTGVPTIVALSSNPGTMANVSLAYDADNSDLSSGVVAFLGHVNTSGGNAEHYTLSTVSAITNWDTIKDALGHVPCALTTLADETLNSATLDVQTTD